MCGCVWVWGGRNEMERASDDQRGRKGGKGGANLKKQNLAPTFKNCPCERLILGDMYTSGGKEYA